MSEDLQQYGEVDKINTCLNCSTVLRQQKYCPKCGQANTDRNISIWTLIQDFLGDYFSFDSKLFRTMIPLLISPGRVPKEFIEGKRVRHIPPLRSFIFISFIFFFVLGIVANMDDYRLDLSNGFQFVNVNDTVEERKAKEESGNLPININLGDELEGDSSAFNIEKDKFFALLESGSTPEQAIDSIDFKSSDFEKKLLIQTGKLFQSDPSTITSYYFGNLSLILLVIQPLFALMLWLLYFRRRKEYRFIGHLVFSFYFHAWVLIISILLLLTWKAFGDFNGGLALLACMDIYLFLAMKKYYEQSWMKTLFKFLILNGLYFVLLMPLVIISSMAMSFFLF